MQPMLIYRVETRLGGGLYRSSSCPDCTNMMQEDMRHPTPEQDARLRSTEWYKRWDADTAWCLQYSFGYGSLDQLRSWIYQHEWRVAIALAGYTIGIYLTTDYYEGDTQAVFRKDAAKHVGNVELTEI